MRSPSTMFSALHLLTSYNQYIGAGECGLERAGGLETFQQLGQAPPLYLPPPHPYGPPLIPVPQHDLKAGFLEVASAFSSPRLTSSSTTQLCTTRHYNLWSYTTPVVPGAARPFRSIGSARRARSEKKPIPDAQKDERYYERRKRNNQAAKKSRDARRLREDQIALRASMLEHENAILRAQIITLREEAQSLRELLLHQRKMETLDICRI